MSLHKEDTAEDIYNKFEVNDNLGNNILLKGLWVKTYNTGYIEIGADIDAPINDEKIPTLVVLDGNIIVNHDLPSITSLIDGAISDPDCKSGEAVIENIRFVTIGEIIRFVQSVKGNNLTLRKHRPADLTQYDTLESLMYHGEYHEGLKHKNATPGEMMCVIAELFKRVSGGDLLEEEAQEGVIGMVSGMSKMMQMRIPNKDVEELYFGGSYETIIMYIRTQNTLAMNSIAKMWKSVSYGPVDIKPIFELYIKYEEQKQKENEMKEQKEKENEEQKEKEMKEEPSPKPKKEGFFGRNKNNLLLGGAAVVVVGIIAAAKILGGNDDVVIVD